MRQRRSFWSCSHRSTITTITAGIARQVCEDCSHVSVSYVEPAVQLYPETEPTTADLKEAQVFEAMITFQESSRIFRCGVCTQTAVYTVPEGLRCEEHAWQAAARVDWAEADPWVPIRIDRSNA